MTMQATRQEDTIGYIHGRIIMTMSRGHKLATDLYLHMQIVFGCTMAQGNPQQHNMYYIEIILVILTC